MKTPEVREHHPETSWDIMSKIPNDEFVKNNSS
jgi:hypothetical protein